MESVVQSITIWGDSILKGVLFNSERDKYTLLKENCARIATRKLGLTLSNRSTMGLTIVQGNDILNKDLGNGRKGDVAVLEFGGNDCDFHWDEIARKPHLSHVPNTTLDVYEIQLRMMIDTVQKCGMRPLLMTLPPLHARRYFEFVTRDGLNADNILSWLGGNVEMIYRWHERYSNAIWRVANDMSIRIVDIRDIFLSQWHYEDLLCEDGIHPNDKGHQWMAEAFVAYAATV